MRLLALLSLIIATQAFADCRCIARQGGRTLIDQRAQATSDCQAMIGDVLFDRFETGVECQKGVQSVQLVWGCDGSPSNLQPKSFTCKELQDRKSAQETFAATIAAKGYLELDWSLRPEAAACSEIHDHSQDARPLPEGGFMVSLESDDEIGEALENLGLIQGRSKEELTRLIRQESPVSFKISRPEAAIPDGDIEISFKQERNGSTSMIVDYRAGRRSIIKFTPRHKFNLTHMEAYFLEERVSKLVLQSADRNRAFFWKADGGLHKIYGTNNGRGRIPTRTHEIMEYFNFPANENERQRPQNIYQGFRENRPKGFFIGGEIGLSAEEAISRNTAILGTVSVLGRATSLDEGNASFAGGRGSLQITQRVTEDTTANAGVMVTRRQYTNGEQSTVYSARIGIGRENWDCEARATLGDGSPVPDALLRSRSGRSARVSCGLKW